MVECHVACQCETIFCLGRDLDQGVEMHDLIPTDSKYVVFVCNWDSDQRKTKKNSYFKRFFQ
jgi:hypothetical protein